jgi:trans-2,3-dihydro-3-hydroxyanthranilate isomerase
MPDVPFAIIDAFTAEPFAGNRAGVVLDADELSDEQMQTIAAELNCSETAFVLRPSGQAAVRIRWFTPAVEVDLCGHATLAAVYALMRAGRFTHLLKPPGSILPIETRSGVLSVRTQRSDEEGLPTLIWLDLPDPRLRTKAINVLVLSRLLGIDSGDIDSRHPICQSSADDLIVMIKELSCLLGMQPRFAELGEFCRQNGLRAACVTTTNTLSKAVVAHSRFFAPAVGIDEDPVTGSVHGALGVYLVEQKLVPIVDGKAVMLCAQGAAGGRAGNVYVVVDQDKSGAMRVRIGGACAHTVSGTLHLP